MNTIGKWADCVGHPSGGAFRAAGFTGVFLYVGTPGRAKNATAAIYRDYVSSGLQVACVFEDYTNDALVENGATNARAAIADMRAMGIPPSTPLAVAADQHLTAGQVPTAVFYQRAFHDAARALGWSGPIGAYGFSEFTAAAKVAGVADWVWQCGSASVLWPGVTFWQRNTGTTTVAGVEVDINDQYQPIGGGAASPAASTSGAAAPHTPVVDEESIVEMPAGSHVVKRLFASGRPHYLWWQVSGDDANKQPNKVTVHNVAYIKRTPANSGGAEYGPVGQPGYPKFTEFVKDRPGPIQFADDVAFVYVEYSCPVDSTAAIG